MDKHFSLCKDFNESMTSINRSKHPLQKH